MVGTICWKGFEYLWISFKMHHPFDCYYSRRKFCDVLYAPGMGKLV